ncbi:MAG: PAS domain S-box protein [Candidatus Hodarchaeota archaeon]
MTSTINKINNINQIISENIEDPILILNEKFMCEYANFEDFKEEKYIFDFVHPDDKKRVDKFLKNTLKHGFGAEESRIIDEKGYFRWHEIKGRRFPDNTNKSRIFLICRDISKFKKVEEDYKEIQNRFRELSDSLPEIRYWKLIQSKEGVNTVQKTREMLELVIDNIPHYIHWKDANLVYLGCNKNFALLNELEIGSDIIGRTDNDLIWLKNNIETIHEKERRVMENDMPEFNSVTSITTKDGNQVWFEINRIPLHDLKQNVVGILSTYEDITIRKTAEEKLKESEEKYRGILDTINEGYFEVDLNGNFTFFNDAFIDLFGYQRQELLGVSYQKFVDEENKNKIRDVYTQVLETGLPKSNFQFQFRNKNGNIAICESSVCLRNDINGKIIGFSGIVRDITEKFLLEQKLKESEQKYHHLFESCPYPIWLMDENGIIVESNSTIINLLSVLKIGDLIGKNFTEVLSFLDDSDDLIILLKERFDKFLRGDRLGPLEFQITRHDGKKIWVSILSSLVKIGGKTLTQAIIQDITDLKKSEEELRILNEELEQIVQERTKELRDSEEKFRNIAEQTSLGIAILQDGYVIYTNQALSRITGYSMAEIVKWDRNEFTNKIHPDDLPYVLEQLRRKMEEDTDLMSHYTCRIITHSKEIKWIELHSKVINYQGKIADLITFIDITEKRIAQQKVIESERKFRHLYENSPYGIVLLNSEGSIIDINSTIHTIFGYNKENLIGNNYLGLIGVYPSETKNALRELPKLLSQRRTLDSKVIPKLIKIYKKDGTPAWVQSEISTIELDNEIIHQVTIQDITEKTNAEEKLKKSEQQYRTTIDSLGDPLHVVNKDLRIILVNKEFERWLERLNIDKEILGKQIFEAFPFLPDEVREEYWQVFENGMTLITTETITLDDQDLTTETRKIPIFSEDKVDQIITIIRDITESKEMENQLIESEEKYRNMVNNLDVGFYKGEYKGKLLMHNQAFNRILGFKQNDSIIGANSSRFFTLKDTQERYYKELEEKGFIRNFIAQVTKKDGEILTININAHLIYNSDGEPKEVEGTFTDITEKFKLEQELLESEKKLREQNIELMKMDQIKNDFITMATHELKTPLISISGYTDYILMKHKNSLTAEVTEDLKTVQRNVKRLEILMDQLLEVMKIDENQIKLQKEQVNVTTIINDCLDELSYQINEKNLEIILDINHVITLNVDTTRIFTIFTNLISNAIKFTPDYGWIEINAKEVNNGYAFEVKDNGIGFTEEEKNQVFKQFGKIERYGQGWDVAIEGTGLGLYITKKLVELHGGKIWLESEGRNKGSTFTFTLPF